MRSTGLQAQFGAADLAARSQVHCSRLAVLLLLFSIYFKTSRFATHSTITMGVPFDERYDEAMYPNPPHLTSSSSEEEDADEELQAYSSDSSGWEDPSDGGLLTLLYRAAEGGDAAELSQLLQGLSVSVDTRGADSDTALHLAALYGRVECARVLLDAGARASLADDDGALPLHDAAAGGYVALVEMLLEAAPQCINDADCDGDTPLHNAARGGSAETVRLLLERGARPGLSNMDLRTPASLAVAGSEAQQLLLAAEAAAEEAAAAAAVEAEVDGSEAQN